MLLVESSMFRVHQRLSNAEETCRYSRKYSCKAMCFLEPQSVLNDGMGILIVRKKIELPTTLHSEVMPMLLQLMQNFFFL